MANTEKKYFYGHEVSEYGREHGFVDYRCFAQAFDAVLNNELMQTLENAGYYFEMVSGFVDNSEEIDELTEKIDALEELDELTEEQEQELDELRDTLEELEEANGEIPEGEIYQYFVVPNVEWVLDLLKEAGEIVFVNDDLDLAIWGVTHWGTSWDYVLTNIKC